MKWLIWIFFSILTISGHEIKVVDGIDKKGERGPNTGLTYHEPDLISGPEGLFFLNGVCFTGVADRYEYSVCPFQNITQRRLIGPSATLLGVWGQWNSNETHQVYDSMLYSNGQTCGRKGRSVQLGLLCGHPTYEVLPKSITEISSCEHGMVLGLPIACSIFTRNIFRPFALSEVKNLPISGTTDFKKSHSTGPSQYTPPQAATSHETIPSSITSHPPSQSPPTTVITPEAVLSIQKQISDLQNALNKFLNSAGISDPSVDSKNIQHSEGK